MHWIGQRMTTAVWDAAQESYPRPAAGRYRRLNIVLVGNRGLAERGRLRLDQRLDRLRRAVLELGIVEHAASAAIAMEALALAGLPRDPIDRFIVATARTTGAVLVTSNAKILAWPGKLERIDAQS
jgi:hypothetical protein